MNEFKLPDTKCDYSEFRDAFEWDLPGQYNIATATLSHEPEMRENVALRHVDGTGTVTEFTFETLDRASDKLASALAADGISMGNRVAVCFPQSPELLVAHLAIYKLGAIAVPISVLLGTDAFEHSLTHSGARTILLDETTAATFPDPASVSVDIEFAVTVTLGRDRYDDGPLGGFNEYVGEGEPFEIAETAPDDPAIILYTSGTTGDPKGVVQTHQYLIGSLPGFRLWYHLFEEADCRAQRVWTPAEWAWAGALFSVVFPALAVGATVVSKVRRSEFDPAAATMFINEHSVTRMFMPPTAFNRIRDEVDISGQSFSTLEVVQCGGERTPATLKRWIESTFDVVVNEAYGQTEANALAGHCRALFDAPDESMGRPYPGHDIILLNEDGGPVDNGEIGEICLQLPDPVVFLEYWRDEAATKSVFTDDGALRTGDTACRDADGTLRFRGRSDNLILSSGYRVSPVEVEEAIEHHDAVIETAVGGVPDDIRGQRIKAYVAVSEGVEWGPDLQSALSSLVRERVGAHKTPDEFEPLTDPPETRSGKIDRSALFPNHDDDR